MLRDRQGSLLESSPSSNIFVASRAAGLEANIAPSRLSASGSMLFESDIATHYLEGPLSCGPRYQDQVVVDLV